MINHRVFSIWDAIYYIIFTILFFIELGLCFFAIYIISNDEEASLVWALRFITLNTIGIIIFLFSVICHTLSLIMKVMNTRLQEFDEKIAGLNKLVKGENETKKIIDV
jgi:hypothetical protein